MPTETPTGLTVLAERIQQLRRLTESLPAARERAVTLTKLDDAAAWVEIGAAGGEAGAAIALAPGIVEAQALYALALAEVWFRRATAGWQTLPIG